MTKNYYKGLDIIRVVACLAVLFYHLDILKGGYLAVCTFFVLSGFLSFVSTNKKEKFSLKDYYKNRIIKIYLPLIIVVFLTVLILHFIPNTHWVNLKVETTSVIFGYNNFWQIKANLDYFARSASSPFTHFWYISILMQFELLFPFIYLLTKKIEKKINKFFPCILLSGLSIVSFIFFYMLNKNGNFNSSYYDSFARSFSLIIGLNLGLIYTNYKSRVDSFINEGVGSKRMFWAFLLVLICLFVAIDSSFFYFPIIMLLVSLITCYLIVYAMNDKDESINSGTKVIKYLSSISYEVYLVQYPIIYIFQFFYINKYFNLLFIFFAIFMTSSLIHAALKKRRYEKRKIANNILLLFISLASLIGLFIYIKEDNYLSDMKVLEEELKEREEDILKSQEDYKNRVNKETEERAATLKDIEDSKNNIDEVVANLNIIGVGDSVMLGAVDNLNKAFKNGYFDAKVSRSIWASNEILLDLKSKEMLNGPVIINLGANGDCSKQCKIKIIETIGDNDIFWLTVTNDKNVHVNDKLKELASIYDNFHVIDWESISKGHTEYFYKDGIHLTGSGRKAYQEAIYNGIKEVYLEKLEKEKEKLIEEYKNKEISKVTFYGNDLLLYAFDSLNERFSSSVFNIDKDANYSSLKDKISSSNDDGTMTSQIVLAFDKNANLSANDYKTIVELCQDRKVYVVSVNAKITNTLLELKKDNLHVIDFVKEINDNSDYLLKDKVHLSTKGNEALIKILEDNLISMDLE